MDTGDGSHPNGNGSADPKAVSAASVPPAGSSGQPPELLVVADTDQAMNPPGGGAAADTPVSAAPTDVPRDANGRVLPGHSLNLKGKPKGIPNRNTQLSRGYDAFRANPELCKIALQKYKIRIRGLKAEQLLVTLAFAKSIVDGDDSLLRWIGDRVYADPTPPAAVGPLIDASDKSQHHHHTETHVRIGEHLGDPGTRSAVADLTERLAARGAFSGSPGHVRE